MKKLNYKTSTLVTIVQAFIDVGLEVAKEKESLVIQIPDKDSETKALFILTESKLGTMSFQIDESTKEIQVFDSRI